tara:strand:- start:698 stop:3478 length:2781 start_codon:yes stop_codon:yes gene_type:complete
MAERIVSPGVFTREKDLSFLPAGIAAIGAAIVGPTLKGPAFVPTRISSFPEFEEIFGSTSDGEGVANYYTPYAVEQYLRSAGTVTIVRVLNTAGYTADSLAIKLASGAVSAAAASGSFTIDGTINNGVDRWVLTNANGTKFYFYASEDGSTDTADTNTYFFTSASSLALSAHNLSDEINSVSPGVSASNAGAVLSFTASDAGTGGNSITFTSGSSTTTLEGGVAASGGETLAVLAPSRGGSDGTADLEGSTISGNWEAFTLTLSGSNWGAKGLTADGSVNVFNASFDTGSSVNTYIGEVFSDNAQIQTGNGGNTMPAYLYKNYKYKQSNSGYSSSDTLTVSDGTISLGVTYQNAWTPYIQSQLISGGRNNLFRVKTRSHGNDVNQNFKIAILNVKKAGSIAGSDYGSFSLQVRQTGLNDNDLTKDNILEQFDNLNFDPTSPNFFARRIGDRYVDIDSDGKLTYQGDWPNKSKHIYVSDYSGIADRQVPVAVVPMGHAAISTGFGSSDTTIPTWKIHTSQSKASTPASYGEGVLIGHDYDNADAKQYLAPIGDIGSPFGNGSHTTMSLEDYNGTSTSDHGFGSQTYADGTEKVTLTTSHIKQRKFVVPFQGGYDSLNPATPKHKGANIVTTNTQGLDCSTTSTGGTTAYKKAINAISNPDEFDINMLVTPGVIHGKHSSVTNHAISKMEARGDAFYVLDCTIKGDTIATATSAINTLDSNYSATYYPWVKIVDRNTALPVWVPPSVVLPGVIAYTDKVAHEWFAPAGLNRGGLTTVLEAETRLTHDERDQLYEDRVNPIASFPGQGVVVWGQKTLQARPSALDRVNVRRLLIKLKKFIASSSRYLVFEQNTTATRNRFLNIVNPYLEQVQSNSGLSAFRVVMDDSNNTPDVVDRNQLVGQIFIQPTRTAEFIVLDFVVLPTGATFPA